MKLSRGLIILPTIDTREGIKWSAVYNVAEVLPRGQSWTYRERELVAHVVFSYPFGMISEGL
jgi:hypothetical protein